MGWFDDDSQQAQNYNTVVNEPPTHKAAWSHELISGAAAYEAAKAWEKHEEANGQKPSHPQATELFASVIGAFVDREVETKGLDFIDKEKAKREAHNQIQSRAAYHYPDSTRD